MQVRFKMSLVCYKLLIHACPVLKGIILAMKIFLTIISLSDVDIILVQNPPSLPVLVVILLMRASSIFSTDSSSTKVVLDWHNLGYSMFASWKAPTFNRDSNYIEPIQSSYLIKFAKILEIMLSRSVADRHICVSMALKEHLTRMRVAKDVTVFYDRPHRKKNLVRPSDVPLTCEDKHKLFSSLDLTDSSLGFSSPPLDMDTSSCTVITRKSEEGYSYRDDSRTFIAISSTSWTPDEDFDTLLAAVEAVDQGLSENQRFLLLITGKGPLRESFEAKVQGMVMSGQLRRTRVRCFWLASKDYFQLLSCGDVGISMHTSTSGLDLPMKALDMLGAGLPVLAYDFFSLKELIHSGDNGLIFRSSEQLQNCLTRLLNDSNDELFRMREFVRDHRLSSWDEEWDAVMAPLLLEVKSTSIKSQLINILQPSVLGLLALAAVYLLFNKS